MWMHDSMPLFTHQVKVTLGMIIALCECQWHISPRLYNELEFNRFARTSFTWWSNGENGRPVRSDRIMADPFAIWRKIRWKAWDSRAFVTIDRWIWKKSIEEDSRAFHFAWFHQVEKRNGSVKRCASTEQVNIAFARKHSTGTNEDEWNLRTAFVGSFRESNWIWRSECIEHQSSSSIHLDEWSGDCLFASIRSFILSSDSISSSNISRVPVNPKRRRRWFSAAGKTSGWSIRLLYSKRIRSSLEIV